MDLVDGFKILPDGITFQQPILVTLPLLEWQPAETLIPVSIFHSQSLEISPPLSAKVTDDGRYIVFPLTRIDSYGITQRSCRWVMVQGSNFTYTTNEVRERSSQYCQNRQKWTRDVSHRLRINVNTSISLKVDKVDLSTQYYFNWHHLIACESDYCRRHYVQAVASATITGFVEICVDQQASAKMDWLDLIWLSEKRVRITSVTYQVGAGQDIEACCDGENCESDDNLCTRDICQDGECVHPDNEKGIACKSACKECDPRTGSCLRYKCKECEKCERAEPPIYGKCTPECITPADCPEPPDPCYRAICRSDGCCDKERVGDPPCDE
jgi:hypothetical protein